MEGAGQEVIQGIRHPAIVSLPSVPSFPKAQWEKSCRPGRENEAGSPAQGGEQFVMRSDQI